MHNPSQVILLFRVGSLISFIHDCSGETEDTFIADLSVGLATVNPCHISLPRRDFEVDKAFYIVS